MLNFVSILVFLLFASSCIKVKNKNDEPIPQAPSLETNEQKHFNYEIVPLPEPQQFHIRFLIGSHPPGLVVNRIFDNQDHLSVIENEINGVWVETSLPSTANIKYQFGHWIEERFVSQKEVQIQRPQDLIIEGEVKWSQIKAHFVEKAPGQFTSSQFVRIFFKPQSQLTTEGENLLLEAQFLHSQGGRIQTWPEGAAAAKEKAGRSGGMLTFKLEEASGEIHFFLRGENGGEGKEGPEDSSLNGGPGRPGLPSQAQWTQSSCRGPCLIPALCLRPGTSGFRGEKGRNGHPGSRGFSGGNSGRLHFEVSKKSTLHFSLSSNPGHGGIGGVGGPGGKGGEGGAPGKLEMTPDLPFALANPDPCGIFTKGESGESGSQGVSGPVGAEGVEELSCFSLPEKSPLCY